MIPPTCDLPARVVLICGPPCSGKSTLAAELADKGDLVADFDVLARQLGSPERWLHSEPYRSQAERRMRELMARLPGAGSGTAYVIRSLPHPQHRAITAKAVRAQAVWVVDPGRAECERRCREGGRPAGTEAAIVDWYFRYSPGSRDVVISGLSRPVGL